MRTALAVAALVVAVMLFAGCGAKAHQDRSAGCDAGDRLVRSMRSLSTAAGDDESQAAVERIDAAELQVAEDAPKDVRNAIETLDRLDPDTTVLRERRERDEANQVMRSWLTHDCHLTSPPVF